MLHAENGFDESRKTRRSFEMANVSLDTANIDVIVASRCSNFPKSFANGSCFDGISSSCARTVSFEVGRHRRVTSSGFVSRSNKCNMGL